MAKKRRPKVLRLPKKLRALVKRRKRSGPHRCNRPDCVPCEIHRQVDKSRRTPAEDYLKRMNAKP